jgi:hypothetical protein
MRTTKTIDTSATELLWRDTDSSVVLTAPHNKAVYREGEYKRRDNNVGVIALEAAKIAGVSALLPLTPGDSDGNWHEGSRFRRTLTALLSPDSTVIDVHGMSNEHGVDVVIGTAGGRSPLWLSSVVSKAFSENGFSVEVRDFGPLSASEQTLTWALSESGYSAIQLEIANKWRVVTGGHDDMTRMINALAAATSAAEALRDAL